MQNCQRLLTSLVLTFALSPIAMAGPISITTADGAGADTQLRQGRPSNNYGASTQPAIKYQSDTSGNNRTVYLRFDLTKFNAPASQLSGAQLQVTEIQGDPDSGDVTWHFDVYGLTNHSLDNWVEGNLDNAAGDPSFITWNNAPGNNTSSYVPLPASDVTLIGTYTVQGLGTTGKIDTVSGSALDAFLQGSTSGLATFIIQRRETETAFNNTTYGVVHRIASKENTLDLAPPTLIATVNSSVVPEPASLSLFGMGCLALAVYRRRSLVPTTC